MGLISQCVSDLDFAPETEWPRLLPAVAWRGLKLTGFERSADSACLHLNGPTPDGASSTLGELLVSLYPQLSLPAFARLTRELETLENSDLGRGLDFRAHVCAEKIATHLSLRWSETLSETLHKLARTPLSFQSWCAGRALAARELAILRAVENSGEWCTLLCHLATLDPSRNHGARILEIMGELYLLKHSAGDLAPALGETAEAWLRRLERLRQPLTTVRDEDRSQWVSQMPWPKYVQPKFVRAGDRGQIEVKFHVQSADDLQRKLEGLSRIPAEMGEWNS